MAYAWTCQDPKTKKINFVFIRKYELVEKILGIGPRKEKLVSDDDIIIRHRIQESTNNGESVNLGNALAFAKEVMK